MKLSRMQKIVLDQAKWNRGRTEGQVGRYILTARDQTVRSLIRRGLLVDAGASHGAEITEEGAASLGKGRVKAGGRP